MSQCIVPNWNLMNHQRQEQGEADQERNRSSPHPHVHSDPNLTYVVPMANYEVTELTWENGQLALHGLGGMADQAKQTPTSTTTTTTWEKPGDHTLESIVHQATFPSYHQNIQPKIGGISTSQMHIDQNLEGNGNLIGSPAGKWRPVNSAGQGGDFERNLESMGSMAASASSAGKWRGNLGRGSGGDGGLEIVEEKRVPKLGENPDLLDKRNKMRRSSFQAPEERAAGAVSACASASATFCRDRTDTTQMTWNSFESSMSLKSRRMNGDDDSACHLSNSENQEGDRTNKSDRRRSRAAAIHNQSERRRRDRINEKMRALQKLVPNASKTDKASMLDEVIDYLKQLQAQVQMMSSARNMPVSQMMMPLGMQQQQQQLQQQMSLLAARMGMGIGMGMGMGGLPGLPMGMFDVNTMARNVPQTLPPILHGGGAAPSSFVQPPFAMAPVVPNHGPPQLRPDPHASVPNFNDAYQSFFAQQSMNMDFFNKMAAIYRQQQASTHQTPKKPVTSSQPNNNGHAE